MSGELSSVAAELSAVAETVQRSRLRIADLAQPFIGSEREDVLSAIYEAERALLTAERTLLRAHKTLRV
jgi:hypothetical protein